MIPKTVHFIWTGGPWSKTYEYGIQSVLRNTNMTPVLHTDLSGIVIPGVTVRPLQQCYTDINVSCIAHRCDIIRLDILYREGGIYSDLDVIWLRNPTEYFKRSLVIGFTNSAYKILCNAVMMSVKEHPALLQYRTWLLSIMPCKKYWVPANPYKLWKDNPGVTMVKSSAFFPVRYNRMDTLTDFNTVCNSICVHLFCSMNDIGKIYDRVFKPVLE